MSLTLLYRSDTRYVFLAKAGNQVDFLLDSRFRGQFDLAMHYFRRVIDSDSVNSGGYTPAALSELARLLRYTKQYGPAVSLYQRLLRDFPNAVQSKYAEYDIIYAYLGLGDTAQAVTLLKQYLVDDPEERRGFPAAMLFELTGDVDF